MHATTSPKAIDLKPAALALVAAAVFAGAMIVGSTMDVQIGAAPAAVVAPDTSYDNRENFRAQSRFSPVDTYDVREDFRAQSGVTVGPSLLGKSGFPSTRESESLAGSTSAGQQYRDWYTQSAPGVSAQDQARGAAGWWATAPVAPATEVEPFDRIGGRYR